MLIIFLVGIVLTAVRAVTKSVASSFLAHVGYNGTLMVLAAWRRMDSGTWRRRRVVFVWFCKRRLCELFPSEARVVCSPCLVAQ